MSIMSMWRRTCLFDQPDAKDKKWRMCLHPLIREMHEINCWLDRIKQMMPVQSRCIGIAKEVNFGCVGAVATITQSAQQPLVGDIISQQCPGWITKRWDDIRCPGVPHQQIVTLTYILLEGDSNEPIGLRSLTPGCVQILLQSG